jgi:hypothetical protein
MLAELIRKFELVKDRTPSHVNELLDYLQKSYIFGELTIVEYKKIFFELDQLKAEKPSHSEFAAVI